MTPQIEAPLTEVCAEGSDIPDTAARRRIQNRRNQRASSKWSCFATSLPNTNTKYIQESGRPWSLRRTTPRTINGWFTLSSRASQKTHLPIKIQVPNQINWLPKYHTRPIIINTSLKTRLRRAMQYQAKLYAWSRILFCSPLYLSAQQNTTFSMLSFRTPN